MECRRFEAPHTAQIDPFGSFVLEMKFLAEFITYRGVYQTIAFVYFHFRDGMFRRQDKGVCQVITVPHDSSACWPTDAFVVGREVGRLELGAPERDGRTFPAVNAENRGGQNSGAVKQCLVQRHV